MTSLVILIISKRFKRFVTVVALKGLFVGMNSHMNIHIRFFRKCFLTFLVCTYKRFLWKNISFKRFFGAFKPKKFIAPFFNIFCKFIIKSENLFKILCTHYVLRSLFLVFVFLILRRLYTH